MSPSGDGIKIIVPINSTSKHHEWATIQVMEYFSKLLNIEIDPSGKDITRLCYYSFDPAIYLNPNPSTFKVSLSKPMDKRIRKAIRFTSQKIQFETGSRNNFVYILCCNLNRYGIKEASAVMVLESKYATNDFSEEEIRSIVNRVYSLNTDEHGIWEQYDIKEKIIQRNEIEENEISELESRLGLNNIEYSDNEMAHFIIQLISNTEMERWYPILQECSELLNFEEGNSVYKRIIKTYFNDSNLTIDSLKDIASKEYKASIEKMMIDNSSICKLSENAIRLFILRFKLSHLKSQYLKNSKFASFSTKSNLAEINEKLLRLKNYNNSIVEQIQGLFATILESNEM